MADQVQQQDVNDQQQTQQEGGDEQQPYDYSAYYQYYQQNPELYMQYMQQWQQYQQQMTSSGSGSTGTSTSGTTQPYDYSSYYNQMYSQQQTTDGTSTSSYMTGTGTGGGTNQQPSNTLWVGSLPWECTEQDLRMAFQEFGQIDNIRMLPAKNCAFVTFTHIECALSAYDHSYGIFVKGSSVKIGWGKATPINMIQRSPYEEMPPSRNIFIGSIDVTISEDELRNFFIQFGPIERVKILPHKQCAFILFTHLESATKAKETMNGQVFKGVTIKVNYGKQPEQLVNSSQQQQHHQHQQQNQSGTSSDMSLMTESKPATPSDPEIQNIIDKLVFFISRSQNSDHLEAFIKKRQENNPKFSFLHPEGEGHDYYKWKLKIEKAMVPKSSKDELPPWLQNSSDTKEFEIPESPFPHIENPLTREEKEELNDLLDNLVGSKESIKHGRDWIFNHLRNALVVGKLIHDYVVSKTDDFSKQLSCLHLIYDVLHHSFNNLRQEGSSMDEFSYSVQNFIPLMMKKAFQNASDEDQRLKVLKLLLKWKENNVFDEETVNNIDDAINSI